MKRIKLYLFVAALSIAVTAFSQEWEWQHPWPTNTIIYNIVDMHENGVIFVGWNGVVLQTLDSGDSWLHHNLGVNRTWSYCFTDGLNQCWAMTGSGELARTLDGGESWSTRELPLDSIVYDAAFLGPDSGWALGHHTIYRTCDAGETWEEIFQYNGYWMTHIVALNNALLVCAAPERGIIDFLYSDDNGDTWSTRSSILCANIADIHVVDDSMVWVLVYRADGKYLLRSMDGSMTWEEIPGIAAYGLDFGSGFNMLDSQRGWFTVSESDSLAYTEDGGTTWSLVDADVDSTISKVYFTNELEGWLLTNNRVYTGYQWSEFSHTTDGGQTWTHIDRQPNATLRDIAFIDENNGWAVGDAGVVLRTEDSGDHWRQVDSPIGVTGYNIEIAADNAIWMSGDIGAIYCINSNSEPLHVSVLPDSDSSPHDIFFRTDREGYVVTSKSLFRTLDRGMTWETLPVELDTNHILESMEIIDSEKMWLYGYKYFRTWDPDLINVSWHEPLLFHTTDGGDTWTERLIVIENFDLRGIDFVNERTGWAVGSSSLGPMILKTTDSGLNWIEQYGIHELPTWGGAFSDVDFANDKEGWVIGSDGAILHTTNGGEIWEFQYAGTRDHFHTLEISHGQAWICGGHGVVLHLDGIDETYSPSLPIPNSYQITAFPNPFNSSTNLLLELSRSGHTTVDIYNVQGQLVERLFDGMMNAGEHRILFDAAALPSGVYFTNVTGILSTTTQKLVLVR